MVSATFISKLNITETKHYLILYSSIYPAHVCSSGRCEWGGCFALLTVVVWEKENALVNISDSLSSPLDISVALSASESWYFEYFACHWHAAHHKKQRRLLECEINLAVVKHPQVFTLWKQGVCQGKNLVPNDSNVNTMKVHFIPLSPVSLILSSFPRLNRCHVTFLFPLPTFSTSSLYVYSLQPWLFYLLLHLSLSAFHRLPAVNEWGCSEHRAGGQDVRKPAPMKGNGSPPCLYKARWQGELCMCVLLLDPYKGLCGSIL